MMDNAEILSRLEKVIASRKGGDAAVSYAAKLFEMGRRRMAQKVGEEAVEVALASISGDRQEVIAESADLLFHLMVLWADMDLGPDDICAELSRREGLSGIDEKNART